MKHLTDFLLARIEEDEALALAVDPRLASSSANRGSPHPPGTATYIGALGVRRVLAECEAKRRIIEEANTAAAAAEVLHRLGQDDPAIASEATVMREVLRVLATPYADHPDSSDFWSAGCWS